MSTINSSQKLPRLIRTGTTSTVTHNIQPPPPKLPEGDPNYVRLGVLEAYRTIYTPNEIGMGPADQVLSIAPSETVEIILETSIRKTVEQETSSELTQTTSMSKEDKTEKELTDTVASLIQQTSTSSVSMSAGGSISVLSVSAGTSASYSETKSQSHETTSRTLRQSTQRVSSEQSKRYVIKTRSVQETSERELHRRVISNSSQLIQHYALRRCFQIGKASVQYLGPRLIIQHEIIEPGRYLLSPRLISEQIWATPPMALRNTLIGVDRTVDSITLTSGWSFEGIIIRNLRAVIVGAVFSNGGKSIQWKIKGGTETSPWYAVMEATIKKFSETKLDRQELPISIRKISSSPNLPSVPPSTNFISPVIHTFYLDREQYEILDQSLNIGSETEFFHKYYAALLSAMDKAPRRNPADLRFEERETLLKRLSQWWGLGGEINSFSYFNGISDLFDIEAAYYFLSPTSSNTDLTPLALGGAFDTTEDNAPARLGMGLGWRIHFDADDRRNEFLNTPSALLNLPIRRGKEADALNFLSTNRIYTILQQDLDFVKIISNRILLEQRAQRAGLSEDSVQIDFVTPSMDENNVPEAELALALYPIKSVFDYQESIDGFLYEPLII